MTRWFRFYDDAVNDPKVQRLPGEKFKAWVNLLCLASKNDGILPQLADIAFILRFSEDKVSSLLNEFCEHGLIDPVEVADAPMSYAPHNWDGRQFKSDVSTDRVKRFRKRERNVSETPPETEQKQIQRQIQRQSEADASDAYASDPRSRLFKDGLAKLASLTGKGPDSCRSFLGKCLKEVGDDAIVVLAAIEDAERNQVIDPSAYIARLLKGRSNATSGSKIIQAADDLRRKIASFDGPASGSEPIRSGTSAAVVRLLPDG